MGSYLAKPQVDEDLVHSALWIKHDNPVAAQKFLDRAFESFELLAQHPEAGPRARLKPERLKDVRFWIMHPPFNRWLIFYRIEGDVVVILRVLYGTQNWREEPESFL